MPQANEMEDVIALGAYQLENLWIQRVPFVLIDIAPAEIERSIQPFMNDAVRLLASEVVPYVQQQVRNPDVPVILICEEGRHSLALALTLLQKNLPNTYIVEGGHKGLL